MNDISRIEFENAKAEVVCFDNGTEVREYQAIIHVANPRLAYAQQLEAVLNAYDALRLQFAGTQAVFCSLRVHRLSSSATSSVTQLIRLTMSLLPTSPSVQKASSSRPPSTARKLPSGCI